MNYLRRKKAERRLRHILSTPFIYVLIVPLVFMDIFFELYHRVCFPLYGLSYISRRQYIRIDRQKLQYLNRLQRLHCMYCGYANGLMQYGSAIAANTEAYWCGIQHKRDPRQPFSAPKHHEQFLPYGDSQAYRDFVKNKEV